MVAVELSLEEPGRQLVSVSISWTPHHRRQVLQLPSWTPGSYLIRDYVQWLEDLQLSQNDAPRAVRRIAVNRWQVDLPHLEPLTLRYRIQASELTVRTCHLDRSHGFLALAAVVMEVEGQRWTPHQLSLNLPEDWHAFLPLPERAPEDGGGWLAADFDALVDTPLELGPHLSQTFEVRGVPHRWVCWSEAPEPGLPSDWIALLQAVCDRCCELMGEAAPAAERYLFILHLLEQGYGGLEHDLGSVLQFSWRDLAEADGLRHLLQLAAHEYLHQWNVRRLRPRALVPYDYGGPVITADLWFAEGITSYLDLFLPLHIGQAREADLLSDLGRDLSRYRLTPGRHHQSLSLSSQEAWVKLYRRHDNAADSQVSYYLKGAVVALCLDLHLRRHGQALLTVLRSLWQRFGRHGGGYSREDLISAFAATAADLALLLPIWLDDCEDPDLDGYLADVGLALRPHSAAGAALAGLRVSADGGAPLLARRVERDGAAARAGCLSGDELLALDGWRLRRPEDLDQQLRPGSRQELLISRRGRLHSLPLHCAESGTGHWTLELNDAAPPDAHRARERWLQLVP
ncbi:M61 family peptidase [Synechococcus sp. RSCCF101]|uniref:M61 family metallopeptidase n=1 Tax=Synechococcus sp. RSCCF101 TaxID=2511069 RepID=UPI00124749CD|nr:M61 family metallopeptidase [Synechococcus sp. RSCCF101]QEY31709.1 M61 family peptidase [Synechococcus sp. RSCCF101]